MTLLIDMLMNVYVEQGQLKKKKNEKKGNTYYCTAL